MEKRTVTQLIAYDTFARDQAEKLTEGKSINSFAPQSIKGKVGYLKSSFDDYSNPIKRFITGIQQITKNALSENLNSNKVFYLKRILKYPSLLRVFSDTQINSHKKSIYLPVYILFNGMILDLFESFKSYKNTSSGKKYEEQSVEEVNKLLNGDYDTYFYDYQANNNWSSKTAHKSSVKKSFKMYDKGLYDKIIPYIIDECKNGNIVNALSIVSRAQITHVFSCIFWQERDTLQCGIYDPIYFVRDGPEGEQNYIISVASAYITLKFLSIEYGFKINVRNLSNYCNNSGKGLACLQFYMNAEYCPIYSMYFFLMFAKNGFKCDDDSLRKTVLDTYIVDPKTVSRENNRNNHIFKFVTTSFILTMLTLISNQKGILDMVKESVQKLYKQLAMNPLEPITILESSIYQLLNTKLQQFNTKSGGYRRGIISTKTFKKHRKLHKTMDSRKRK